MKAGENLTKPPIALTIARSTELKHELIEVMQHRPNFLREFTLINCRALEPIASDIPLSESKARIESI